MPRADFLIWKKKVLSLEFFREQNLDRWGLEDGLSYRADWSWAMGSEL